MENDFNPKALGIVSATNSKAKSQCAFLPEYSEEAGFDAILDGLRRAGIELTNRTTDDTKKR